VKLAVQELVIDVAREDVFAMFVDPELFVRWMAVEAVLDPVPGGVVRWRHANGDTCAGRFVELDPPRRLVFSYGWERAEVEIPPGSTLVEIDLTALPGGSTRLRLVHHGLGDAAAEAHHVGWGHYLDRLRQAAGGEDVGDDLWADRRVPTPAELARA
jgi:uncharacterized protein YndB with AHSA1/START domain